MDTPAIFSIPPEILLLICHQLTLNNGTPDLDAAGMRGLVRLGQTCSAMRNHFVLPLLYNTLTFTPTYPSNPFALHHLVGTLASSSSLSSLISAIHIFDTPSRPDLVHHPRIPFSQPYSTTLLPSSLITTLDRLLDRYPASTMTRKPHWRSPTDWFLAQRTLLELLLCLAAPTLKTITFTKQWQVCHLNFTLREPLPLLREVTVRKHKAFTGRWCEVDDTRALVTGDARALLRAGIERLDMSDCYGGSDGDMWFPQGCVDLTSLTLTGSVFDAGMLGSVVKAARGLKRFSFLDRPNINCCSSGDHADQILPGEMARALHGARETLESVEIDLSHTLWHYEQSGQGTGEVGGAVEFEMPVLKDLMINHSMVGSNGSSYLVDLVRECPMLESLTITRIRWMEGEAVSELADAVRSGWLPMLRHVVLLGYQSNERAGPGDDADMPRSFGGGCHKLQMLFESAGVSLSWKSYSLPHDSDLEQRL